MTRHSASIAVLFQPLHYHVHTSAYVLFRQFSGDFLFKQTERQQLKRKSNYETETKALLFCLLGTFSFDLVGVWCLDFTVVRAGLRTMLEDRLLPFSVGSDSCCSF